MTESFDDIDFRVLMGHNYMEIITGKTLRRLKSLCQESEPCLDIAECLYSNIN